MYCPKCGENASIDQRYCRSCGFDMRGAALAVRADAAGLHPEEGDDLVGLIERLHNRRHHAFVAGFVTAVLGMILLGLSTGLISEDFVPFAAVLMAAGIVLTLYALFALKVPSLSALVSRASGPPGVAQPPSPRALQPQSPSVTETTTELLDADRKQPASRDTLP